jgi:hypothetical protein
MSFFLGVAAGLALYHFGPWLRDKFLAWLDHK